MRIPLSSIPSCEVIKHPPTTLLQMCSGKWFEGHPTTGGIEVLSIAQCWNLAPLVQYLPTHGYWCVVQSGWPFDGRWHQEYLAFQPFFQVAFQAQSHGCFIPFMLPRMTAASIVFSCLGHWAKGLAEEYHTLGPPGPQQLNPTLEG